MACKIAALRKASGRMLIGDGVEAFDQDVYLGDSVEPVGGVFVVIEITDADKDNTAIVEYTKQWLVLNPAWVVGDDKNPQYIPHNEFDRKQYLQPVFEGDDFFTELLTTGRVSVTLTKFKEYIRIRS